MVRSSSRVPFARTLTHIPPRRAVFAGGRSPNDPDLNTKEFVLATIARDLIKTHGWLLAFDEVQLVDIAGAGLINRVLSWYWRLGGVVVGTSNRVPEGAFARSAVNTTQLTPLGADLYNQGVQRDSVNGFLVALASRSPVIELRSALDYRREQRGVELDSESDRPAGDFGQVEAWKRWGSLAKGWYVRGEEAEFEAATKRLVGEEVGEKKVLKVYGRDLVVPWVVGGVARFSFHELCEKALGPADFITIGSNFVSSPLLAPGFSLTTWLTAHPHHHRRSCSSPQRKERSSTTHHSPRLFV